MTSNDTSEPGSGDSEGTLDPTFPPTFEGLTALVGRLRGPDGCPWDREQTRESFRDQFLEEAYELIEALDGGDPDAIAEEVGDVLLHAAFQIRLGTEEGEFTETDVLEGLIAKLVRRHPHVFDRPQEGLDAGQVLANWDDIKRAEKPAGDRPSAMDGVPSAMPALARAERIQRRAARTGFDWDDAAGVMDKVREEIGELQGAATAAETEAELGDVLFSLVNAARWMGVDAETALRKATERFATRFRQMELAAEGRGDSFKDLPLGEKEALWEEAKLSLRDGV